MAVELSVLPFLRSRWKIGCWEVVGCEKPLLFGFSASPGVNPNPSSLKNWDEWDFNQAKAGAKPCFNRCQPGLSQTLSQSCPISSFPKNIPLLPCQTLEFHPDQLKARGESHGTTPQLQVTGSEEEPWTRFIELGFFSGEDPEFWF